MEKILVNAICYSDDREHEHSFDAAPWLLSASEHDLRNLQSCDYGGDYGSDAVAEDSAEWDESLAQLFAYVRRENEQNRNRIGFECHVNGERAEAYLISERPEAAITLGLLPPSVAPAGPLLRPSSLAERQLV